MAAERTEDLSLFQEAQAPDAEVRDDWQSTDGDSALGDEVPSDTCTLASTILRHREENGRTYHKFRSGQNDYWGPNDEQQNDQLDIGHHMFLLLLDNKLYLAPINEDIQRVVDLGCGTGIWTMDFADAHPSADVLGIDLSPIQPPWVPPNCRFVVDDFTSQWVDPEDTFDLVHLRCLFGSVSDWPGLYRDIYTHMKPGGWLQQLEMSIQFESDHGTIGPDHIMKVWSDTFIEAGEKMGKTFLIADRAGALIREAGFEDVEERHYKMPVGKWTKDKKLREIGFWNFHYCNEGCEGWAIYLLTRVMGWSMPEVQIFVAKFRQALKDPNNFAYLRAVVVYGRKPLARDTSQA